MDWAQRTIRRFCYLLGFAVILFTATEIVALTGKAGPLRPLSFRDIIENIYFTIGFSCPLALYLSSLPRWRELTATLALGVLLTGILVLVTGRTGPEAVILQLIIGLGLACLVTLAVRAWRQTGPQRIAALMFLMPGLLSLVATLEAGIFFELISSIFPLTYDPSVYRVDEAHGTQLSFVLGRAFRHSPLLKWTCYVIYVAPPPTLMFVYGMQVRTRRPPPVDAVTVLMISVIVGYSLYFLYPVAGPDAAFRAAFPGSPPASEDLPERMEVPYKKLDGDPAARNGMPSLHFASVLLAYWHARPFGWLVRGVAAIFLGGTFLATLGLGEHFFADLVVALPFTLLMHSGCTPRLPHLRREKWTAVFGSTLLLIGWYVLLFTGVGWLQSSAAVTWALTLGTAGGVWVMERRLYRAAYQEMRQFA